MPKTLVIDAEFNGLNNPTEMWALVAHHVETDERREFVWDPERKHLAAAAEYIADADHVVMHNGIGYDRHHINRLCGVWHPVPKITDTMLMSRLFNSNRLGGHRLEDWGVRFKIKKVGTDIEDWSRFQPIMVARCHSDVDITLKLWRYQKREGAKVSKFAKRLEHEFQECLDRIKERGFPIDIDLLKRRYAAMDNRRTELQDEIREAFPPRPKKLSEVTPKVTKAGEIARNTKGYKAVRESGGIVWGPFTLFEFETFNIGSPKQVVERLDECGWDPYIRTKSGKSWKVCEENLNTLKPDAPPAAKYIAEFLKLKTRIQLMDNWLDHYNPKTGRIHGTVFGIGAISHRCAHQNPNTANIPGNDEWNIRECWGYAEGRAPNRRIVGVDAKGIQLRVLGHLTRDPEFIKQVTEGDPHAYNREKLGLKFTNDEEASDQRQRAKAFIYAWLLGAGLGKVKALLQLESIAEAKAVVDRYLKEFKGLGRLKKWLHRCSMIGWFPAPDGRFIPIKEEHYALAMGLQSIESIVMRLAIVLWFRERDKRELDAHIVAFVHDEVQMDCHADHAQEAGQLFADCIKKAGETLKLHCPMDGDEPRIARNWKETH